LYAGDGDIRIRLADTRDVDHLQTVLDGASDILDARVYGMSAAELLAANQVYIGYASEAPIGCVMATFEAPVVIHCLSVVVSHRRNGFAGVLLAAAVAEMDRRSQPLSYWAAVDPARRSAEMRFSRLGFIRADTSVGLVDGMQLMFREAQEPGTKLGTSVSP